MTDIGAQKETAAEAVPAEHIRIAAHSRSLFPNISEIRQYRDLIGLLAQKSFKLTYKQTILGPLWIVINPLLSSIVYLIVFGKIARLGTGGMPGILFYFASNAIWTYFSSSLTMNANTFRDNAYVFGRVYFPRLVVPISVTLVRLLVFLIQFSLTVVLVVIYTGRGVIAPHFWYWFAIPLILLQIGVLGTSVGILISSLTTKYRDLSVLVSVAVWLWMYLTPIVYPYSTIPLPEIRTLIALNPMTAPVEFFRYAVLGAGIWSAQSLLSSLGITLALAVLSLFVFERVERTFMDTI